MVQPVLTLAQLGATNAALSAQVSALQFALNTQVATLQDEINALMGGAGAVPPTPNTLVLRDGSGGAKATYFDSGAAADLPIKYDGTTKLTIGATLITAAVAVAAPTFTAATGVATPYVDSGANVDLVLKRNNVVKVTVGLTGVDFGSETLTTTGLAFSLGASPASIGMVRLANASAAGVVGGDGNGVPVVMRNFAGSGDLRVVQCNNADDFVFGSQDPRDIYMRCSRNILLLGGGGTWTFSSTGAFAMPSGSGWDASGIGFADGATAKLYQADKGSAGAGAPFLFYGQKGNGPNPGGLVKVGGGPSGDGTTVAGATQIDLGTSVSNVSAKASFISGSSILDVYQADSGSFGGSPGTPVTVIDTAAAEMIFRDTAATATMAFLASGATQTQMVFSVGNSGNPAAVYSWNGSVVSITLGFTSAKLGLFGVTPVVQRQMTDTTTGTAGNTLKPVTSNSDANDNFATLRRLLFELGAAKN